MIEWMEYPIGLANLDEEVTITWADGSQDVVPGHDGDGETIYQLPNLMEEIFRVRFYHLWESHEAKFADEYPGLYRYKMVFWSYGQVARRDSKMRSSVKNAIQRCVC